MRASLRLGSLLLCLLPLTLSGQGFTLQQVMSAPFCSHLTAAPAKGRIAWTENREGLRNLWLAESSKDNYTVRQLTPYNTDDGQEITDLEWSADAEQITYTRGGDIEGAEHPVPNPALITAGVDQEIWAVSTQGGSPRKLAKGHSATTSIHGDIAFLLHGQIWITSLNDPAAKPTQLFSARGEMGSLRWSPTGDALAFVSDRDDHSFVGVYTLATKRLQYLDPATANDGEPVWSPDGRQIAFVRIPPTFPKVQLRWARSAEPWSIRVADAATGEGHEVWRAMPGRGSAFREISAKNQLLWSAGDHLVFPWEADGWTHLWSVPSKGGIAGLLTPGPFEVEHVTLNANRRDVVYDSNQYGSDAKDADRRHIWTVAAAGGGMPKQLTSGDEIEASPVVSSDGVVNVIRSDARTPGRPAALLAGRMQDLNPGERPKNFPATQLVQPEQVIFPAADGMPIHGQLFLPREQSQKKHPAVVFFHGGSRRQMLLGWHYMEYYANTYAMAQYLASLGYVVLSVNYRSGIGYGMEFRQAVHYGAAGASEYNDVTGAGQYLRGRADVDAARIGVWGGSYGGYLTALALARNSDIFAAGVDLHGVHDWRYEIGLWRTTSDSGADVRAEEERRANIAWTSSPMADIDTWRSPVLLMQGDDDRNVYFGQTVRLAAALRQKGVPVEEYIFPDEVHNFLLHRNWLKAYELAADFFARKMPGTGKETTLAR